MPVTAVHTSVTMVLMSAALALEENVYQQWAGHSREDPGPVLTPDSLPESIVKVLLPSPACPGIL